MPRIKNPMIMTRHGGDRLA